MMHGKPACKCRDNSCLGWCRKSTLVNHWLRGMAAEDYRSAQLVFGWSFYRQGSRGDTSSADEFLDEVRVTVSASDSMKREVLSFLTRELRALGDIEVEVVDTAPRYQIEVVALETSSRASTVPTGYAVSAIVTSPVYLGLLREYGIAFSGQHWARATEAMADLGCSPAPESRHQLPHVSPGRTGSND